MGRGAVRTRLLPPVVGVTGNFWSGLSRWGQKIMVKVYGVAMMMPQGYSRVPNSPIECK